MVGINQRVCSVLNMAWFIVMWSRHNQYDMYVHETRRYTLTVLLVGMKQGSEFKIKKKMI